MFMYWRKKIHVAGHKDGWSVLVSLNKNVTVRNGVSLCWTLFPA